MGRCEDESPRDEYDSPRDDYESPRDELSGGHAECSPDWDELSTRSSSMEDPDSASDTSLDEGHLLARHLRPPSMDEVTERQAFRRGRRG